VKQRKLGSSGLLISEVGLGCNNFGGRMDKESSRKVIDHALELGITFLDTADVYGGMGPSETILGEVLGKRRDAVVLATKFGFPMDEAGTLKGASRRYAYRALDASLRRLRTDWIDLYQVHRPDPATPLEETMAVLDEFVRSGKVRYIGLSNHPAWKVVDAQWIARENRSAPIVSCQDEYSLLVRDVERELIPALEHLGLGLLPYFPLAAGMLTGKYHRGASPPSDARLAKNSGLAGRYLNDANYEKVESLRSFCEQRGRTLLELAFSWVMARPTVACMMAGATSPAQLDQNVKAVEWSLTADELAEIDRITSGPKLSLV
jgi:aryl-alcohol dehydrogenase-like predicted oxidoreductase